MLEAEFRLICRVGNSPAWRTVSNPFWESSGPEGYARAVLLWNEFVDYCEYYSSGVAYRVIRQKDLSNYSID